jgi:putative ABC transport system permease protein
VTASDQSLIAILTLDGEPYTVIGVMPDGSPFDRCRSRAWVPIAFKATERTRDYPASNKGFGVTIDRFQDMVVGRQLKQPLYVLLAAVGMLLLIGCANMANLMLAGVRRTALAQLLPHDGGRDGLR